MEKIVRGQWTEQQILDRLLCRDGASEIKFRCDILRAGAKRGEIRPKQGSTVTMDADADIMRTGRIILPWTTDIDWLKDELNPIMMLRMEDAYTVSSFVFATWNQRDALKWTWDQWDAKGYTWDQWDAGQVDDVNTVPQYAEFSLGVLIPSTPRYNNDGGVKTWEVEAYDRTVILMEDSLTEPLYVAEGTKYLDVVADVLVSAGITDVLLTEYVTTEVPADREFEIGKKKLDIINALLEEINFNKVYCDAAGSVVISAYRTPSAAAIDFKYAKGALSVISQNIASETDLYGVPNVFIGVCSNFDLDQDYTSVYVNDNPISRLSTVQRGRRIVSEIFQLDQVASQEDLDAAVVKIAFEANQVSEEIVFSTALMPFHGYRDTLDIDHSDIQGTFVEHSWEIPLEAGEKMTHTARRLVIA